MGGVAKGLLRAPDGELTLVERLVQETVAAAPGAEIVLVGAAEAYVALRLTALADAPPGIGPLGGLLALLHHGAGRGAHQTLALACDLPRLDRATIARLLSEASDADALAIEHAGVRNPLIARYTVQPALVAAEQVRASGRRSLQAVLDALRSTSVAVPPDSAVADDWDTPSDVRR